MNNDLISVIIPTYNREKSILLSIASVLNQTYLNLECIVVDDASTDNTEEIVRQVMDSRLVYLKLNENSGSSFARNIGIRASKGDYIAFEDSDDVWMPDKLEKQIKRIKEDNEVGLVYCGYSFIKDDKEIKVPSDKYDIAKLEGYIFNSLWEGNKIGTPTILIEKKCIDICGGFSEELRSLEDWEFVLRISDKFKIAYVNECLVHARYSPNGVNEQWECQAESIIYIFNKYKKRGLPKEKIVIELFDKLSYISDLEKKENWGRKLTPELIASTDDYYSILNESIMKRKYKRANQLIFSMSNLKKLEKFVHQYIDINKEKVAIYGAGYIGIFLARMLKILNIPIMYIVDQNEQKSNEFLIVKPDDIDENVNKIILTVLERNDFEQIALRLPNYLKVINILDFLFFEV